MLADHTANLMTELSIFFIHLGPDRRWVSVSGVSAFRNMHVILLLQAPLPTCLISSTRFFLRHTSCLAAISVTKDLPYLVHEASTVYSSSASTRGKSERVRDERVYEKDCHTWSYSSRPLCPPLAIHGPGDHITLLQVFKTVCLTHRRDLSVHDSE